MQTRAMVKQALRTTHTLELVDRARLGVLLLQQRRRNQEFISGHPSFALPPAGLAFDAYGHIRADWYYETGAATAGYLAGIILRHTTNPESILDWGCGAARVIRHMPEKMPGAPALFGVDYNARTIEWCRGNIPEITFQANGLVPPLEFAENSFDCVYGLSVLTHLSAPVHFKWRDELLRVLKPGGVMIVSTNGDHFAHADLSETELTVYSSGECVEHDLITEGKKWFTAYQSSAFMRENLMKDLDIVEHIARPALPGFLQELWIVRK